MKTKLFLFISLIFFGYSYAQIGFEEHNIQENANGPYSVYTADINNDGSMDVISCSIDGNTVVWHENTDGQGAFETRIIQENVDGAVSVYAADIDGDGDVDVICAAEGADKFIWYENLDRQGSNWNAHIIQENKYTIQMKSGVFQYTGLTTKKNNLFAVISTVSVLIIAIIIFELFVFMPESNYSDYEEAFFENQFVDSRDDSKDERFLENVKKRVGKIADFALYPSVNDIEALAENAFLVMRDELKIQEYK